MNKKQLSLNLYQGKSGGRRPGSGRKRIHSKGVAHRIREKVTNRTPLHINFKYRTFIKNKYCLKLLKRAIINARAHGLRIIHFSLQSNHVHLIIEAENNDTLTKGMRSLTITFAKGLNKGKVQIERYHLHVLKTIKETKHAVQYVLFNQQKHGAAGAASDDCKDLQSRSRMRREEKGHIFED
ncbi:transposase [Peredibacter starrii]|uniref:Transposase n=1 Tax=Peredibacter starrii TaxID=28202 RepID=A0AAX4HSQ5_9BACT|nr:transposase [Peredibacter starrii]WPU66418.1 transposase [Peredibacter starrii]